MAVAIAKKVEHTPQERAKMAAEALAVVEKARIHVAVYHCFYGALLERLKLRADWRHPTMYTDAVVVGFNPEFILTQRFESVIYILIHEVTHCAMGHPFRRKQREPKKWNVACDHVVNLTLNRDAELLATFVQIDPPGLADARFNNMAAEEIFAVLEQEEPTKPEAQKQKPDSAAQDELPGSSGAFGDCCDAGASGEEPDDEQDEDDADDDSDKKSDAGKGNKKSDDDADEEGDAEQGTADDESDDVDDDDGSEGGDDESDDADDDGETTGGVNDDADDAQPTPPKHRGMDEAQRAELEREWGEATMTAQLAAGGDIDATLARAIGESQARRKSFLEHVEEFATRCRSETETWSRPNRRYADVYLPSKGTPNVSSLVLGIDTSGSIDDKALGVMEKAAQWVMDDFGLKSVHVVYCDTAIRGIDVFNAGDEVKLEARGGGGTAFHPVFRYALEQQQAGEDIAGVIYLSDLDGPLRDVEDFRDITTLWVQVEARSWRKKEAPEGLGTVCNIFD